MVNRHSNYNTNTSPQGLPILNVALVGDLDVGKTSLIRRIRYNTYTPDVSRDTIGEFEDVVCRIPVKEGLEQKMVVRLHDTGGMERVGSSLTSNFFRNKDGFILTWDISRGETYRRLDGWESNILNYYEDHNMPAFIVIANKADRYTGTDAGAYEICLEKYTHRKTPCYKTSAMDDSNVKEAFQELLQLMGESYLDRERDRMETRSDRIDIVNSDHPTKDASCCNIT